MRLTDPEENAFSENLSVLNATLDRSTARYDEQYQHFRNMQVADIDQEGFIE